MRSYLRLKQGLAVAFLGLDLLAAPMTTMRAVCRA